MTLGINKFLKCLFLRMIRSYKKVSYPWTFHAFDVSWNIYLDYWIFVDGPCSCEKYRFIGHKYDTWRVLCWFDWDSYFCLIFSISLIYF